MSEEKRKGYHRHPNGGGWVEDTAHVDNTAYVGSQARVYGQARVYDQAQVYDQAWVSGKARVSGEARVKSTADVITIGPIGSRSAILTVLFRPTLSVVTGCFTGTLTEFEAAITKTHGDNRHTQEYRAAIAYIRQVAGTEKRGEMTERTEHITINGKYRVVIERAASTKGVLGYKIESNGDDLEAVLQDAEKLKAAAEKLTASVPETPVA